MISKLRALFSAERRAERNEIRRANRAASEEYRNDLASDADTTAIRQGLGNRSGPYRQG